MIDSCSQTWHTLVPLTDPTYKLACELHEGKIFIVGGKDLSNNAVNTVNILDPETETWLNLGTKLV